jgi:hypothetical protein
MIRKGEPNYWTSTPHLKRDDESIFYIEDGSITSIERSNMTNESLALFKDLIEDAPNWNGQPLLDISKEERGNLTQLKREGLLKTVEDEGNTFALFTQKGISYAREIGLQIRWTPDEYNTAA